MKFLDSSLFVFMCCYLCLYSAEFGDDMEQYRAERLSRQDDGPYAALHRSPEGSLALATLNFALPRAQLRDAVRANGGRLTPALAVGSWLGPRGSMLHELFLQSNYTAFQDLHPLAFDTVERQFYFLPLLRSERLNTLKVAMARLNELHDNAPRVHRPYLSVLCDYAAAHLDLVTRFGRFPQRNVVLGRVSTPEELAWLQSPEAAALAAVEIYVNNDSAAADVHNHSSSSAAQSAGERLKEARQYARNAETASNNNSNSSNTNNSHSMNSGSASTNDAADAAKNAAASDGRGGLDAEAFRRMMAPLPLDVSDDRQKEAAKLLERVFASAEQAERRAMEADKRRAAEVEAEAEAEAAAAKADAKGKAV